MAEINNSSNVCDNYRSCDRLAANTLMEVLEFCNGAHIYLNQYNVARGKQCVWDMI